MPLRDKAKQIYIGTASLVADIIPDASDPQNSVMIPQQFNMLTIGNELKWDAVEPTRGTKKYGPADTLATFAKQHNMRIRGHCLIWHAQLPNWVNDQLGKAELKKAVESRIK